MTLVARALTTAGSPAAATVAAGALADGMTATTQAIGDNSTKLATDAYVDRAVVLGGWQVLKAGQWFQPHTSAAYNSNAALTANRLYVGHQARCLSATTASGVDVKLSITTGGAAGKLVKAAVYTLDATGTTLTKVAESPTQPADAIAVVTCVVPGTFVPGNYWIGVISDGAPQMPLVQPYTALTGLGQDPTFAAGVSVYAAAYKAQTFASLEASFATTTLTFDGAGGWLPIAMTVVTH